MAQAPIGGGNPVANPMVVLREEFDDWAVLFNPDTAEAMGVNPVGVAVWKMLDGTRTVEEIIAGIRELFDDVPSSVVDEVSAFIGALGKHGFAGYERARPDR